jgi:5'-nucleotidase
MKKPLIFVTNDDGIQAGGIRCLIEVAKEFGKVVVLAPDKPQSGMSHAITVTQPLRIRKIFEENGVAEYSCNGTPVDSVKLGEKIILRRKPDLVLSGVNHGSNASINIIYSGTMAAVLEACIDGIPAIGFSLLNYAHDADFSPAVPYLRAVIRDVLENGLPQGVCLNVNIPAVPSEEIKGIRVCRQADSTWEEEFDERIDPHKREYYWLKGIFKPREDDPGTDHWALSNNFVSVVPVQFDFTAHSAIDMLRERSLGQHAPLTINE